VDVLLLLVFAGLTAPSIRMIGWYAPVFGFVLMPHIAGILKRKFPEPVVRKSEPAAVDENGAPTEPVSPVKFVGLLLCFIIPGFAFALSPLSYALQGRNILKADQIYSHYTPLGVTEYLQKHPADSIVCAPQWWGDWVAWDCTTHIHLAPPQVWKDYRRVERGLTGWERTLDRYRVRTLVVDKTLQQDLARVLRGNEQWKIVYEDKLGIVARRVNPPG
jgi:hypothetical protein